MTSFCLYAGWVHSDAGWVRSEITTFAEWGKIQLTPKITNHLCTCYSNCMCKSNPVCLIQQSSVIILLASYYPLHCIEFGPPKFFSKLSHFQSYFTQLCKFQGVGTFEKHADNGKKNRNRRKSRANSRNLLETFLRSRQEENLYGHCAMNNVWKILSKGSTLFRGYWFWPKKLRFRKNFDENFNAEERVMCNDFSPVLAYENWPIDFSHLYLLWKGM